MSKTIKWDVWGRKVVIEAETEEAAITLYRTRIAPRKREDRLWNEIAVEAKAHESTENAEALRLQRDEWKAKYEEEVARNREAREALDRIHETLEDTSIYDRDD